MTSNQQRDTVTELHGGELTQVLNNYYAVLETDAAFEQPQVYCPQVATGPEVKRCIITQGARTFHDNNTVLKIRVIEYQEDCAVAIAVLTSVGSTATEAYLFHKEDKMWKVADMAYAVGELNRPNPHIPFGCK